MIITRLKRKHDVSWLRFSMPYHRFPNLRDIFQSHLSAKMIKDVELVDFLTWTCNCKASPGQSKKKNPKEKMPCQYDNICRIPIMIYKVTCSATGKIYIRNTQQFFKSRMKGHFQDVKTLVNNGIHSNSVRSSLCKPISTRS
jgi:hypothetical protein